MLGYHNLPSPRLSLTEKGQLMAGLTLSSPEFFCEILAPNMNFLFGIQLELSVMLRSLINPTPFFKTTLWGPANKGLLPSLSLKMLALNFSSVQSSLPLENNPWMTTISTLADDSGPDFTIVLELAWHSWIFNGFPPSAFSGLLVNIPSGNLLSNRSCRLYPAVVVSDSLTELLENQKGS